MNVVPTVVNINCLYFKINYYNTEDYVLGIYVFKRKKNTHKVKPTQIFSPSRSSCDLSSGFFIDVIYLNERYVPDALLSAIV